MGMVGNADNILSRTASDDLVRSIDPYAHNLYDPNAPVLCSIDHINLLLAIYATLRRIEDRAL